MHILILGGTSEANALAHMLAGRPDIRATLSLAGRTKHPVMPPIACRIGGFGGPEGLAAWMREHKVTALIDATHPFARVMPFNTLQASSLTGIPLLSFLRPPWQAQTGDQWTEVEDHAAAIAVLGTEPKRIFLTVGRLEIEAYRHAPQHFYVVRSIDPVESRCLPNAIWLTARGPFSVEGEQVLLTQYAIDTIITKNSGGSATSAKLAAGRALGIKVILIARPPRPVTETVATAQDAMKWILRHTASS